ncbi:MAG: hypothetical protein V3U03_03515 [Myxococcota bacterium]
MALAAGGPAPAGERLYVSEGNRLLRLDLESSSAAPGVLIERASQGAAGGAAPGQRGRDVNGMVCPLPDGSGRFVIGEDTGQPDTAPGWGVFSGRGEQVGKLTATYFAELGDPYGCAFSADGRLFTTEVGNAGFGAAAGQLLLWFPPYDRFPGTPGAYPGTGAASARFCKIASDIGTASGIAIDERGRVYVASASRLVVLRFSPPFPRSPDADGGCGAVDALGSPLAEGVKREVFARGPYTYAGLAFAKNGNLYAASVFTGQILEYDPSGRLVRKILDPPGWLPPFATGNPMGIAVDAGGSLYYADLDLVWDFPRIGPGPDGKVRRIRFDARGRPGPPEILLDGLAFPDAVTVLPGAVRR